MVKLAADALKLPLHVDFASVQVDALPGQPERFAEAKAQNEHEHIRGFSGLRAVRAESRN